jgi:hypothetical protein
MATAYLYAVIGHFATDETTTGFPVLVCSKATTVEGRSHLILLIADGADQVFQSLSKVPQEWVYSFLQWIRNASDLKGEAIDQVVKQVSNLSVGPLRTMTTGSFLYDKHLNDFNAFLFVARSYEKLNLP